MLGKTAGGLFWMFRYLERAENTARLIEAGFRIALTRPDSAEREWSSLLDTVGARSDFEAKYEGYEGGQVVDFLLRDKSNPNSVMSSIEAARNNARLVRTALTREVWEAVNEDWMVLKDVMKRPVKEADLPGVLSLIRRQSALVRGAMHGTMLRNDIFDFARIGTFLERSDNTARILDVKYYVLLPSVSQIGTSVDNIQWEMILRSVASLRSFRWLHGGEIGARDIADFLILDARMPRSLAFCVGKIAGNLSYIEKEYGADHACFKMVSDLQERLKSNSVEKIFEFGLHEFIVDFLNDNAAFAAQLESDFRFYE